MVEFHPSAEVVSICPTASCPALAPKVGSDRVGKEVCCHSRAGSSIRLLYEADEAQLLLKKKKKESQLATTGAQSDEHDRELSHNGSSDSGCHF